MRVALVSLNQVWENKGETLQVVALLFIEQKCKALSWSFTLK